jgi:hypothetical protein
MSLVLRPTHGVDRPDRIELAHATSMLQNQNQTEPGTRYKAATGVRRIPEGASRVTRHGAHMAATGVAGLVDGATCKVVAGTHAGKAGVVRDINTSKTGHVTITVEQDGGARFKTLAKNVVVTKQP